MANYGYMAEEVIKQMTQVVKDGDTRKLQKIYFKTSVDALDVGGLNYNSVNQTGGTLVSTLVPENTTFETFINDLTADIRTAITTAKTACGTDAQTKATTALNSAKAYSDTNLNTAKSYADTKKSEAIASAKTYTDTTVNTAKSALQTQINNINNAMTKVYVFATQTELETALTNAGANDYKLGDSFLVIAANTPDYWVSEVSTTRQATKVVSPSGHSGGHGCFKLGYVTCEPVETKLDLSGYSTTTQMNNAINNAFATQANKTVKLGSTTKTLTDANGKAQSIEFTSSEVKSAAGLGSVVNKGMDTTVTSGSANYVTSGAVYTAIANATPDLSGCAKLATANTLAEINTFTKGIKLGTSTTVLSSVATSISNTTTAVPTSSAVKSYVDGRVVANSDTTSYFSAVQLNAYGVVKSKGQFIVVAANEQDAAIDAVPVGGFALIG